MKSDSFNVFVSSTYEDLAEHRKEVTALIDALGLHDVLMERWGPSPRPPKHEVEQAVRTCDIYLGIIGWKRGSMVPDVGKSYVRFEYELARDLGLRRLVFLTSPKAKVLVTDMDRGAPGDEVFSFRDEIENEQSFVWSYFEDVLDLIRQVSGSLFREIVRTRKFEELGNQSQLILELRHLMQSDFLSRESQIRDEKAKRPDEARNWIIPSLGRCNLGHWYIPREKVSHRVAEWLVTGETNYLFILGPAGIGKTNFLVDFIRRAHSEASALKGQVLLMLPLGSYVPEKSFLENLETVVNRSGRLQVPADAKILREMVVDGQLILVLDGLDEFARQQGEAACERVFAALNSEIRPPHVVVSCRDHIFRRLRGRALPKDKISEVHIPPLMRDEIIRALERRMGAGSVPCRVVNHRPGLLDFAKNPLLFEMMCEMSDRSWRRLMETQSIGKVYDLWFEEAVEAGAGDEVVLDAREIEEAKLRIGRIATMMLEERSDLISSVRLDQQSLPSGCLRSPGQAFGIFIQETPSEWGFVHDSLRDFALAKSVTTELTSQKYELVANTTHWDYVGAEMYRFLRDLLEVRGFARHVDDALDTTTANSEAWNRIVWMCFEAAGMVASGEAAVHFIDKALEILSPTKVSGHADRVLSNEAKYNIARCVERLHPSAPKPYCDYVVSRDWGRSPDWDFFGAWAVRGFQSRERFIGAYPPMTYRLEKNDGTGHRQEEVSAALLDLLENALTQNVSISASFVAVNCAFALIRWLHPGHVTRLKVLLLSGHPGPEVKGNMFVAVTRFKTPRVFEGTSDLFSGMILNLSHLSRDMIPEDFVFRRAEFRGCRVELNCYDSKLFEKCQFS